MTRSSIGDVANITPTAFTFENVSRYPVQGFVGMKTRVNKKKKKKNCLDVETYPSRH